MSDLLMSSSKRRWKNLVDGVWRAIALPGFIKKSHVTAIVIETKNGTRCRFVLEERHCLNASKPDGLVEEVSR